jgi:hypothetical protein
METTANTIGRYGSAWRKSISKKVFPRKAQRSRSVRFD